MKCQCGLTPNAYKVTAKALYGIKEDDDETIEKSWVYTINYMCDCGEVMAEELTADEYKPLSRQIFADMGQFTEEIIWETKSTE